MRSDVKPKVLNVAYALAAIADVRRALPSSRARRTPWYVNVAAEMKLEPIRNRDRPRIEFPSGNPR